MLLTVHTLCILHAAHRWTELLGITQDRKALLSGAAEVHLFIREADDTKDRMSDKVRCVGIESYMYVCALLSHCARPICLCRYVHVRTHTHSCTYVQFAHAYIF